MSQPSQPATSWNEPIAGVRHLSVFDDRIQFRSDAFAVPGERGWVLIDPLPWTEEVATAFAPVEAVVLTAAVHQRAAWSIRRQNGCDVWAPEGGPQQLEESPDVRFAHDCDVLPGGLRSHDAVGPTQPHVMLLINTEAGCSAFVGDLIMRIDDGPLSLVPPDHQSDASGLRASVRDVARRRPDHLWMAHGIPLVSHVSDALDVLTASFDV